MASQDLENKFKQVLSSLKSDGVIPDVIPKSVDFSPSVLLTIVWPKLDKKVTLGDKIKRDCTDDEPEITLAPKYPDVGVLYTLVVTDPDAPSHDNPKWAQFRHWVQTGVKVPGAGDGKYALKTKKASTKYSPPAPPEGTGYHRYVFLLFEEPSGGLKIPDDAKESNSEESSRKGWNAIDFAEKYNLKLVGANYFFTEVPKSS